MGDFSVFTNFDCAVFQLVEKLWNPVLDAIMIFITHLGDDGIFWIALGVILCIFKKTRKYGVLVLLGLGIASCINNLVLKQIFERPRPFNFDGWPSDFVFPNPLIEKPHSFSFPSGHTSSSLGAATPLLIKANKKLGIPMFILALLVGFSRVYIHVHYPTDVIVGTLVGIVGGILAVVAFKYGMPLAKKILGEKLITKIFGEI
jgi:undecaprenyl-diphosphatase